MRSGDAYTFTVFTPTYNRAHTLHRVFESLRQQTFRDFEWLIVDDGSTDGTRERVAAWQHEANFPIRYLAQQNAGKHVAFNRGVAAARGELFLTLDSDDACVPHALERLKFHWDGIPPEQKERFSAVTVLCLDEDGNLVGTRFPRDVTDSDSLELEFTLRVVGEKWGFHRTDVLRRYPFPEPPGVKFVPESLVWFAIARDYRTRFVNEPLRIYHTGEVAGGRLMNLTRAAAQGRLLHHRAVLNEYLDVAARSPSKLLKSATNYSRYAFSCGIRLKEQLTGLRSPVARTLVAACLPCGYLLSRRDRARPSDARQGPDAPSPRARRSVAP
jgi:glycosyltransferase involved in cell wall biosynthesis